MAKTLTAGDSGMIDPEALRRYVSRCESLVRERKAISVDLKEVYDEAKEAGFVTAQIRQLVRESMMEPLTLKSHLEQMDSLRGVLGWFADTPLGEAAILQGAATQLAASPAAKRRGRPRKPKQEEMGEPVGSA